MDWGPGLPPPPREAIREQHVSVWHRSISGTQLFLCPEESLIRLNKTLLTQVLLWLSVCSGGVGTIRTTRSGHERHLKTNHQFTFRSKSELHQCYTLFRLQTKSLTFDPPVTPHPFALSFICLHILDRDVKVLFKQSWLWSMLVLLLSCCSYLSLLFLYPDLLPSTLTCFYLLLFKYEALLSWGRTYEACTLCLMEEEWWLDPLLPQSELRTDILFLPAEISASNSSVCVKGAEPGARSTSCSPHQTSFSLLRPSRSTSSRVNMVTV